MSLRTLPLLFINLGGEMLYILDQRLRAQNIPPDKAKKVMNDIITTMFNKKFMEELFKPQELYSKKALRTVFDRLAHASIMRLNQASMDKVGIGYGNIYVSSYLLTDPDNNVVVSSAMMFFLLFKQLYDLMTMAFKYQVLLCPRPKDILLVTFNHMDAIKDFIRDSPSILNQVDETFRQLIDMYNCLPAGEFQLIRQTLLIFFQDMHIRVSIFLKDKVQNSNGRFVLPTSGPVPWGTEVPGLIRQAALTRPEELSYKVINIQASEDGKENKELTRIMGSFVWTDTQLAELSKGRYTSSSLMDECENSIYVHLYVF
ncbi:hypothetical protein GDO81_005963 [Engystomops pustulosus]|uniref:Protein OSCP1 n=1 Tax=Engystomops pustulosus TaxID=76066 RepID=A0AAV7CTC3_ENGPU|nr:hypothetical protein GDO81_005963 [Engystomops pustulosus]